MTGLRCATGFDPDEPIWSESVMLECVDDDASSGFVVRLGIYPDIGLAWLWVHIFQPDEVLSFNVDHMTCPRQRTSSGTPYARYGAEGPARARLWRTGPPAPLAVAGLTAEVHAHRSRHAPSVVGSIPVSLRASFTPGTAAGSSLPGRHEVLGEVTGSVWVAAGRPFEVSGRGHWHEQHQEAPRFRVPFTYASLRGEGLAVVAALGVRGARGFVHRRHATVRVVGGVFEPPGPRRSFALDLEDGTTLQGTVKTVHDYSVPIHDVRRAGTLVSADVDGHAATGTVNDFDPRRR